MNPVDVDLFERGLVRYLSGGTRKIPDLTGYAPIAAFLIQARRTDPSAADGINERIAVLKPKLVRCADIAAGYDQPDPDDGITESWIDSVRDIATKKDWINKQKLASEINSRIKFARIVETGEFLRYDVVSGIFVDDAAEYIGNLIRKIIPDASTTHIVNEGVAWIRDDSMVFVDDFDRTPPGLINLKNGVYNIQNGKLLPHSPDYHFRWVLPFRFNRRAKRSRFFDVLEEITKDDLRKAVNIMETFAWPLIPGYPIQQAVILNGNGYNGKSTILDVLVVFLGRKNVSAIPLQTLCDNRFAVSSLRGKLANIAGDVGNGTLYDTSAFKQLTGGDLVSGEIKGMQKRVEFVNSTKMIYSLNRLPRSWDTTNAFYRRFKLIELIQNFEGRAEKNLLAEITREEDLQAIFNVVAKIFLPALLGKLEFEYPEKVEDVARRYDLNSNPALAYINENLEADPEGQLQTEQLYSDFTGWCKQKGISPVSEKSFGYTISKRSGMVVYRRLVQEDGVRKYYYRGVRKSESDPESDPSSENHKQRWITFGEAVKDYVQRYQLSESDPSDLSFYTLSLKHEYRKRVQKLGSLGSLSDDEASQCQSKIISEEVIRLQEKKSKDGSLFNPHITEGHRTKIDQTVKNSAELTVPDAILDENPVPFDWGTDKSETNENPKFRTYVVIKDFAYYGRVYSAGMEFVITTDLGEYVSQGVLGLKEGPT